MRKALLLGVAAYPGLYSHVYFGGHGDSEPSKTLA